MARLSLPERRVRALLVELDRHVRTGLRLQVKLRKALEALRVYNAKKPASRR